MRKFYLYLIIIGVTQVFTLSSYGQGKIKEMTIYKSSFTLNTGRIFLNEIRFGYERKLTDRHSLRAIVGLQYPTEPESFRSVTIALAHVPNYYKVSEGFYLGTAYNYILGPKTQSYVCVEIYFNYNFYDKKYYHYNVSSSSDSYVSLESMDLTKTGIKVIFGRKVRIISGKSIGVEIDFFGGVGIQYRVEELKVFKKSYGLGPHDYSDLYVLNPAEINIYRNWYPSLHMGILIGLLFEKKNKCLHISQAKKQ